VLVAPVPMLAGLAANDEIEGRLGSVTVTVEVALTAPALFVAVSV
jgi:hypothetical protein